MAMVQNTPTSFEAVITVVKKLPKSSDGAVTVEDVSTFTGLSNTEVIRTVESLQTFEAPLKLSPDKRQIMTLPAAGRTTV